MEIQVDFAGGLRGVWHRPARARRPPAVVLLHGFTGSRVEDGRLFVRLGRGLAELGVACLRFDFRGSGDSAGDFADATLSTQVADAHSALRWVRRKGRIDPARIGLLGFSLGSVVAQLVAADERVTCLALWAAITRPAEVFRSDLGAEARGYRACSAFLREIAGAHPLVALARYRGPLLCVHGSEDFVPVAQAQAALACAGGELSLVAGAPHSFGSDAQKREVVEITRRFFARTLRAA